MAARKKRVLTPEEQLEAALVPESEWPHEVPDNWCWVRISSGFEVASSKRVHKQDWLTEGIPFYRTRELVKLSEDGHVDNELFISKEQYQQFVSAYGRPQIGDLLISGVGTIGVPYIVASDEPFYFKDGNIIWFKNRGLFLPEYVYFVYKSVFMQNQIHAMSAGTTVDTYTIINANRTLMPLPPLHEQRRIASRIEWLFAKLNDAEAELREVIDSSEQRQAAILHRAFNGELTKAWRVVKGLGAELESWQPTTSDELFEYVTSGSRGWAKYYSDTGAVFLRMGNLDHGTIELDLSDIQHVELPDRAEGQRSLVKKDDILISITADVGMIGFVRNIDYEAYVNQHVALARPTQPKSAEFIAWYLVSDMGFVQLRQKQRGATKVGLGLDDIRSLTLLMPTESEQELILEVINSCMDNEVRMVEAAEKAIGSINKTRQSILTQALRGKLGTNDPNEPSSKELLASILSGNAGK